MNKLVKKIFLFICISFSINTIFSNKINAMRLFRKQNRTNTAEQNRLENSNKQTKESRNDFLKIQRFLNKTLKIIEDEAEQFKLKNENLIKEFLQTINNNLNTRLKNILQRIQQLINNYPINEQQIINQLLNTLNFPWEEKIFSLIENNIKPFFQNKIFSILEIEENQQEIEYIETIKNEILEIILNYKRIIQEREINTVEEIIINIINPLIKNIFAIITKIENQILIPRINQLLSNKYNKLEIVFIRKKILHIINSWKKFLAQLLIKNASRVAEIFLPITSQIK